MRKIIEENLLLLTGLLALMFAVGPTKAVIGWLVAIIFTEANLFVSAEDMKPDGAGQEINQKKIKIILLVAYLVISFAYWPLAAFLPALVYEVGWCDKPHFYGIAIWSYYFIYQLFEHTDISLNMAYCLAAFWLLTFIFAILMGRNSAKLTKLNREIINLEDSAREMELKLKATNHELLEQQDQSVHLATLQERNRIAREIHDNVGHMLSRTILQMAALMTIYKEEPLNGQLSSVNETLNTAMNNIRESVHDLHDESLDLHQAVLDATSEIKKNYSFSLDYDMSKDLPRTVKYCFLSIVKEAMNNIIKHSNATKVSIVMREHPGFYQMAIEDNGNVKANHEPGIGLHNMTERVDALEGSIHFETSKGFKILVSIPKTNAGELNESNSN